jgi:hypothetical protein
MQAEDSLYAIQSAGGDDVKRATGDGLFCWLEDQPHAVRQQPRGREFGQDKSGAENDGRMDIVATSMAGIRPHRTMSHSLLVGYPESIQIGSKRYQARVHVWRANIANQSSGFRELSAVQSGGG